MKSFITLTLSFFLLSSQFSTAQIDSTLLKKKVQKSTKDSSQKLNMDAMYNRPFMSVGKTPVSLGGYMEANWQRVGTDGVTAGDQFQFRRLSLFTAASISKRIKFLSEIEFENELEEEGGSEIEIEFAALDIELHPLLNLRGGIIVNPIGSFNQNHDGPKWEFTDRPVSSTEMLPATFNNSGFGLYGKHYKGSWMLGYELYLTGGFDNSIIANEAGKTFLPEAKENPARFVSSNSGSALTTAKLAIRNRKIAEVGISYMGGIYNKWQQDGLIIDTKRRCDVVALDMNTTLPFTNTYITTEFAWIFVDVPLTYTQSFGNQQRGGFADIVQPVLKRRILGWEDAVLNLACRVEYVDWNVGTFRETGDNIYDNMWSVIPAMSFRPNQETVLRLNYRIRRDRDLFGNPPSNTAGLIFGVSTYF